MTVITHGGNLRLFEAPPPWQADYADTLGGLVIFAENAFGAQYCEGPDGLVVALDPESRDLDETGVTREVFLALVDEHPGEFIDQDLFEACCQAYGRVEGHEHFDFVLPLVLGGSMSVGNVQRLTALEHMTLLADISRQLHGVPPGTQIHPVLRQAPRHDPS